MLLTHCEKPSLALNGNHFAILPGTWPSGRCDASGLCCVFDLKSPLCSSCAAMVLLLFSPILIGVLKLRLI